MFDRVLAPVLKSNFGIGFKKLLKRPATESSALAHARACAIQAFIDAWRVASTPSNCISTARTMGVYPYNPEAAIASPFVRDLTVQERERYEARLQRLNTRLISSHVITEETKLVEITNAIKRTPRFEHLCDLNCTNFSTITRTFIDQPKNGTYMLSHIPHHYIKQERSQLFFLNCLLKIV